MESYASNEPRIGIVKTAMGARAQFAVFTYAEMRRTPRYEIRLAAFYADNLMNSVAHCGGVYLRDIVEEKCRLRPTCRKLSGLSREKTRITPRLSETSGAQQRKNVDYKAFRNVGYNKCRDAHRGRMFRLLWTFVDLKLPSAMSHAIHKIVSKERCQSYFIDGCRRIKIERNNLLCEQAPTEVFRSIFAWLVARLTFYLLRIFHNIFVLHEIIDQRYYGEDQCDPHNNIGEDL